MIVVALHNGLRFLEADVVEPGERRTVDVLYLVIRYLVGDEQNETLAENPCLPACAPAPAQHLPESVPSSA